MTGKKTAVNFRFFEFLSNALFTLKIQTFDFGVIIIKDFFMLRITIGSFRFHRIAFYHSLRYPEEPDVAMIAHH